MRGRRSPRCGREEARRRAAQLARRDRRGRGGADHRRRWASRWPSPAASSPRRRERRHAGAQARPGERAGHAETGDCRWLARPRGRPGSRPRAPLASAAGGAAGTKVDGVSCRDQRADGLPHPRAPDHLRQRQRPARSRPPSVSPGRRPRPPRRARSSAAAPASTGCTPTPRTASSTSSPRSTGCTRWATSSTNGASRSGRTRSARPPGTWWRLYNGQVYQGNPRDIPLQRARPDPAGSRQAAGRPADHHLPQRPLARGGAPERAGASRSAPEQAGASRSKPERSEPEQAGRAGAERAGARASPERAGASRSAPELAWLRYLGPLAPLPPHRSQRAPGGPGLPPDEVRESVRLFLIDPRNS